MPERSKSEGKTSSLRSVRVKPDRTRDMKDKPKPSRELPHTVTSTMSSLPDKSTPNQPVTSAVAPVADKPVPDKSASPLEGKENIPIMNSTKEIGQTKTDTDDDIVEVPYKPPTPEIINLDDEEEGEISSNVYEVKKRKLDILKEGGLEVTAVSNDTSKDVRPSVIQQPVVQHMKPFRHEIGNLSITVSSEARKMPPPQNKRPYTISAVPNLNKRIAKDNYNGLSPPKVLQSKSIYTYSEKTVYGNPKDTFVAPQPVVVPKHIPVHRSSDVLDLTVKSPQKPIVEIMRVPNVPSIASRLQSHQNQSKNLSKNSSIPNLPGIEGRLGSNLEITLVSANSKVNQLSNSGRTSQKRTSNGTVKSAYNKSERSYEHLNVPRKSTVPNLPNREEVKQTNPYLANSHLFPSYLSQLAAKGLPTQAYLPLLDPMYYSALCSQGLGYPMGALPVGTSLFPQGAPVDQLQLFKDLMARGRFPFVPPQDTNMTVTSVGQTDKTNIKK